MAYFTFSESYLRVHGTITLVCLRWMLIKSVAKAKVPFTDNRIHIPKA